VSQIRRFPPVFPLPQAKSRETNWKKSRRSAFLTAILYELYVRIRGGAIEDLLATLEGGDRSSLNAALADIMRYASITPQFAQQSWPTLLKSQAFFDNLASYLQGLHSGHNSVAG
jgi:hypothetical protein